MILLRVPDSALPRIVQELCLAELPFHQLTFVLCETWLLTETLEPLRNSGAQIASLVATPVAVTPSFVVEGDLPAVRQIRRLLERGDARTIELRPGAKPLYFAADSLLRALPGRSATRPASPARRRCLGESTFHSGGRDGPPVDRHCAEGFRVNYGGPLLECTNSTAEQYFARLKEENPKLAASLQDLMEWARPQLAQRAKSQSA